MILQEKIKNTSLLNKELSNEEVKSIVEPARESVNAKTALFSIRPEYVEKIFNGTKKFEYRKQPNRIRDFLSDFMFVNEVLSDEQKKNFICEK